LIQVIVVPLSSTTSLDGFIAQLPTFVGRKINGFSLGTCGRISRELRLICETLGWPTCAAVINPNGEFVELLMNIRKQNHHEIDAKEKLMCGKQRKSFSFYTIRVSSIDGNDKQSICGDEV
jgi:hypothetical protein